MRRAIIVSLSIAAASVVLLVLLVRVLMPLNDWFRTLGLGATTALIGAIVVLFGLPLLIVWALDEWL